MTDGRDLRTLGIVCMFMLSSFAILVGSAVADEGSREDGEPLPNWDQGQMMWTRFDDTELDIYVLMTITYTDSTTPGGPYIITTELRMSPSSNAIQNKYTIDQVSAEEYKISIQSNGWENGSWATVVTDDGGHPSVESGDTIHSGSYVNTLTCTGTQYYERKSLNFVRAEISCHDHDDMTGGTSQDPHFTLTDDYTYTESTTGGASATHKPNWGLFPFYR